MNTKQIFINMMSSSIAFAVTLGLSFLLTPYIVSNLGAEAYGFIGLANNFIDYALLITIALNSMAGRFITIKIHENDHNGANVYFNSVLVANMIMSFVILIPFVFSTIFIDNIIDIPQYLFADIQLTFALTFLNFIIVIITSVFGVATFAANRLDLQSLRGIESNLIKVAIILILFVFFQPKVYFIVLATLFSTVYISYRNMIYTKKLLPNIIIDKSKFNIKAILELIASGVWNVILKLGQILTTGVDLLISNIFIGPASMGLLALAKLVPNTLSMFIGVIANTFSPQFTLDFAKKDKVQLLKSILISSKILVFFASIAIAFLIAFGEPFFSLWVPSEDSNKLQSLSILIFIGEIVSISIYPLFNIFTVLNKVKLNAIIILFQGLVNIIIVVIVLKFTNLGIYAVAGVSTLIAIIKNLTFTPIYAATCLNVPKRTFYPNIILSFLCVSVLTFIFFLIKQQLVINSWIVFLLLGGICLFIGLLFNSIFVLSKSERAYLLNKIKLKVLK